MYTLEFKLVMPDDDSVIQWKKTVTTINGMCDLCGQSKDVQSVTMKIWMAINNRERPAQKRVIRRRRLRVRCREEMNN